jgi:hypothetical protein
VLWVNLIQRAEPHRGALLGGCGAGGVAALV